MTINTLKRKNQIEDRLASHGINDLRIDFLPYLEFDDQTFATPFETGCRMIILLAVAATASDLNNRQVISDWLSRENIWEYVSPNEKELFEGNVSDPQKLIDFSWQIECAYILGWTLNLTQDRPIPTEIVSEKNLDDFVNRVPAYSDHLNDFLSSLNYRETTEIFDENLFYELATTYFRDLLFNGQKDASDINRQVSFLRHWTLNWVRRFMGIRDWDDTDTST
jgi:hypothetical protein